MPELFSDDPTWVEVLLSWAVIIAFFPALAAVFAIGERIARWLGLIEQPPPPSPSRPRRFDDGRELRWRRLVKPSQRHGSLPFEPRPRPPPLPPTGRRKLSREQRARLWRGFRRAQGGLCPLCNGSLPYAYAGRTCHLDHVVPLARGGPDTFANLQATHARCNLRKGDGVRPRWGARLVRRRQR